jgi:hypothetical protein
VAELMARLLTPREALLEIHTVAEQRLLAAA